MRTGYTQPTDHEVGQQTYVKDPSPDSSRDYNHEKAQVLPSPPWGKSKPLPGNGTPQLGKPPGSDNALDGKPLSTDRARTLSVPGDDSPHPNEPATSTPVRRPGLRASVTGPQYPGTHKQKEQGGKAKKYYEKYYLKNRSKIKNRAKRWNKKWKNQVAFKDDRARRKDTPERYERMPAGYRDPADRTKDWREQNKKATIGNGLGIPVYLLSISACVYIVGLDEQLVEVVVPSAVSADSTGYLPLSVLFNGVVFYSDKDIEMVYSELDAIFGCAGPAYKEATFFYEKRPPDREPGQVFDRATPSHHNWPEHDPTPGLDIGQTWNNPGSSRVIPEGHDFENKSDRFLKEAAKISEILDNTDQSVHNVSRKITVSLSRVDVGNRVWLFDVPGSKGQKYRVRVKAEQTSNVTDINKMDVTISCSCPFWRWQGPEHWAKKHKYLYGKPVGTASTPGVMDPSEKHWACKHVLAVLDRVKTYKLDTRGKTASGGMVLDRLATEVADQYIRKVVEKNANIFIQVSEV